MRHLAATEAKRHLHLVAFLEKSKHGAHLHIVVMHVDVRAHLDFLDLDGLLLLARLVGLFLGLILEFAVVEELAHGRLRVRRYLDQVKTCLLGHLDGFVRGNDAALFALGVYEQHGRLIDHVVYARALFRGRRLHRSASYEHFSFCWSGRPFSRRFGSFGGTQHHDASMRPAFPLASRRCPTRTPCRIFSTAIDLKSAARKSRNGRLSSPGRAAGPSFSAIVALATHTDAGTASPGSSRDHRYAPRRPRTSAGRGQERRKRPLPRHPASIHPRDRPLPACHPVSSGE